MFQWISINNPNDYDALHNGPTPIGSEYAPVQVADELKQKLSPIVKGVLLELEYSDKDYRSTYYNFYAKKRRAV